MTYIQAIVLGIVQGLTEFIPISSSAHLIIVPWLFHWNSPSLAFDISLHLGTLISLLWFFITDWIHLLKAGISSIFERKIRNDPYRKLAWQIVLGCIPGAIVGVLFESQIEELFHKPDVPVTMQAMLAMAGIIILLGVLLFIAERGAKHRKNLYELSMKNAMLIGLAQALSIFPGVSRSGSTITAGLATGIRREDAARFSFLLGAPLVAGAGIIGAIDVFTQLSAEGLAPSELLFYLIGFITSAIVGYLCIKLMLRFLQKNSTDIFVYYRFALAVMIIGVALKRG